jgi:hypothetical protein
MKYPGHEDQTAEIAAAQKIRNQARIVLLLAISGMVTCSMTGRDLDSLSLSKDWLVTDGVMLKSSIVRTKSFKFPYQTNVHPDFVYSYIVNGKPYETEDTSCDSNDEKVVGDVVSQFTSGSKLKVHYRSKDPTVAYFDHKGVNDHTPFSIKNLFFILGLAAVIAALALAIRIQKSRRDEQKAQTQSLAK